MEKLEDKVLKCRQCRKEFIYTEVEQEFYTQRGWSQPRRCPKCRVDNRNRSVRFVCSSCGSELAKGNSAYCSTCADNLKLEAEFKLQGQQKKVAELETKLEELGELEMHEACTTAELEKYRQTKNELQARVQALECENSKLAFELASSHALEASVRHLREEFETFQQSYVREAERLLITLQEVKNVLTQRKNGNLLKRAKFALMGIIGRWSKATDAGDLDSLHAGEGEIGRGGVAIDSGEEAATTKFKTLRAEPTSENSKGNPRGSSSQRSK